MSPTQSRLLDVFADGAEHTGWDFGAGTLAWAKKRGFVEIVHESPRRYRITDRGRAWRDAASAS